MFLFSVPSAFHEYFARKNLTISEAGGEGGASPMVKSISFTRMAYAVSNCIDVLQRHLPKETHI